MQDRNGPARTFLDAPALRNNQASIGTLTSHGRPQHEHTATNTWSVLLVWFACLSCGQSHNTRRLPSKGWETIMASVVVEMTGRHDFSIMLWPPWQITSGGWFIGNHDRTMLEGVPSESGQSAAENSSVNLASALAVSYA